MERMEQPYSNDACKALALVWPMESMNCKISNLTGMAIVMSDSVIVLVYQLRMCWVHVDLLYSEVVSEGVCHDFFTELSVCVLQIKSQSTI